VRSWLVGVRFWWVGKEEEGNIIRPREREKERERERERERGERRK
jgi:hypothetical protein